MDKTPKNEKKGYIQIILESPRFQSPGRNLTGLPRVTKDAIADFYNTIQKWNDLHIKGSKIVKEIASIRSNNFKYSDELFTLSNSLYFILEDLILCIKTLTNIESQIISVEKLVESNTKLFFTLTVSNIIKLMEKIRNAYEKEYEVKKVITEKIAHSNNEDEVMFLAAYWTYQINITPEILQSIEILLIDSGHRKIS